MKETTDAENFLSQFFGDPEEPVTPPKPTPHATPPPPQHNEIESEPETIFNVQEAFLQDPILGIAETTNVVEINKILMKRLLNILVSFELTVDYSKPQNVKLLMDLVREIRQTSVFLSKFGQEDIRSEREAQNKVLLTAEQIIDFLVEEDEDLLPKFVAWLHKKETEARSGRKP